MSKKLLTIGIATYDDYDGLFFTTQALKLYHRVCNTDQVEFVIIDNNPDGKHGKFNKDLVIKSLKQKYIPETSKKSTSIRNEIFKYATGKYTICMDSHVLIVSGGIDSLLRYYQDESTHKNIVSGPLLFDELENGIYTHFKPVWDGQMYGVWGSNRKSYDKGLPFEIQMQGLGCFSCVTENWQGINENFRGFGAEEGYLHEKFRRFGGKAICLPEFKWVHRFDRPYGVMYPIKVEDRVFNYFVGWMEIDPNHHMIIDTYEHFSKNMEKDRLDSLLAEAIAAHSKSKR